MARLTLLCKIVETPRSLSVITASIAREPFFNELGIRLSFDEKMDMFQSMDGDTSRGLYWQFADTG